MSPHTFTVQTLEEMQHFAALVAKHAQVGSVIALKGDLGVGKTAFSKAFIGALGCDEPVTSPTFNIVQLYETAKGQVWHFDLYRIEKEIELEEIGLHDALEGGITIIEWPEIADHYIKKTPLLLIEITQDIHQLRTVKVGVSLPWQSLLKDL